jgi:pimeloyl-ACP methyl ester carboxylesterase
MVRHDLDRRVVPACLVGLAIALAGLAPAFAAEEPADLRIATRDGVRLAFTYLPGKNGKQTVPVVLLHAYKGDRRDYRRLAVHLQSLGHAVFVPDLRGHGDSNRTETGSPLTPASVNFQAMVTFDMEAIASYLVEKNNQEQLNLDALSVVGAEMGAAVAGLWAALDWSRPPGGSLGQDVKALVLLSPKVAFRNLKLADALRSEAVAKELSVMILAGKENGRALAEATRVNAGFAAGRLESAKKENRDLFFGRLDSQLQGTDLLTEEKLNVPALVGEFIDLRIVKHLPPWRARAAAK